MRKKQVLWKKLLSGFLAVTMVLGSVAPMQANAEESGTQEEAKKTLLYFVDAGDHDVTTVSEGDEFGANTFIYFLKIDFICDFLFCFLTAYKISIIYYVIIR